MERWSSKLGFVLAAIGSAVGIGNIWRFPSVVGQNGGGGFLFPYLIAVFMFALPLMILELAIGRGLRRNVVSSFEILGRKYMAVGWAIWLMVLMILSYYLVITGWTLGYFIFSLSGINISFDSFISSYQPIVYFFLSAVIVGVIISIGVRKGIEKIVKFMMPFSIIILLLLAFYSLTLSGFMEGIRFLFRPDFSVLKNPLVWASAFGQAFFSLSVGFGILITYGSYMDKNTNIPSSSIIITLADLSIAILAGFVIFPIVFTYGLHPGVGAELAFSTLPKGFEMMPFGQLMSALFFLTLFFVAITSAIAMMEMNSSVIIERKKISRKKASFILTIFVIILGLPSAMSYSNLNINFHGDRILDIMDKTIGTLALPLSGLMIALIFGWFFKKEILKEELNSNYWFLFVSLVTKFIPIILFVNIIFTILQIF
ncbi:MAG: sodium-dependent transporter [Thermoplasmatales archaeon]|nr:sodium-dependent transporter [Thermoplasmatales archaeon]